MIKINNNQMSEYTTEQLSFTNNNETVFTEGTINVWEGQEVYVVYSYGKHFPMYLYDYQSELWFGNEDKYSPTTSKHQTLARPQFDEIHMLPTDTLKDIIHSGGYRAYCADKCGVLVWEQRRQSLLKLDESLVHGVLNNAIKETQKS
jgi:hypothetical protein